jgi:predicted AlkP superfamily pyrophosphatase or phosphodiesterase
MKTKAFTALAVFCLSLTPAMARVEKPKLILVIAIDQFRADYLQKFSSHFLPASKKGFNYLMDKGAYFSHAEYGLLQNMTGPGHATILSGAYAYQHGIPNNDWVDAKTQEFVYCVEDQGHKTVGASPKNSHIGTSPKNLVGTTLGDELKNAYADSRVVTVALKDRSAILMGGHRADLAIWFDAESFSWVTSDYYAAALPAWLVTINQSLQKKLGTELVWEKKIEGPSPDNKFVPVTKYNADMGLAFPHKAKVGSPSTLMFPIAIDMPGEVAISALKEMRLGQKKSTDILAISFSSHDYVGHSFGPESHEIKETTVLEDKAIAHLLNTIDETVPGGLDNTWIVLTADHGVAGNVQVLGSQKIPSGYVNQGAIAQELESYLTKRYGKAPSKWVGEPSEFNFYLNKTVIRQKNLDLAKIQTELAKHISSKPELLTGIAYVFSAQDVKNRILPPGQHERQILRTYFEGRSGDVMMIPRPNYLLQYGATTHMTGYAYDRYVPLIFAGGPFKAGTYAGGEVVDIAPTLAFLLGIIPPTGSEGKILEKALVGK